MKDKADCAIIPRLWLKEGGLLLAEEGPGDRGAADTVYISVCTE